MVYGCRVLKGADRGIIPAPSSLSCPRLSRASPGVDRWLARTRWDSKKGSRLMSVDRLLTDASHSVEQHGPHHNCPVGCPVSTACHRLPFNGVDIQLYLALANFCGRGHPSSRQGYIPCLLGLVSFNLKAGRRHGGCWPLHPASSSLLS